MSIALVILGLVAGGLVSLQSGLNNTLRNALRAPIGAALISFLTGLLVLLVLVTVTGEGVPGADRVGAVPWWAWLGGSYGVAGVAGTILLIPRLGAATTVALNITGQMLMSLVLDADGWLGVPEKALSLERAAGAALVVVGAVLISWRGARRRLTSAATTAPGDDTAIAEREPFGPRLVGMAAALVLGTTMPIQAATNARLRAELDAPFTAAALSFGGGC